MRSKSEEERKGKEMTVSICSPQPRPPRRSFYMGNVNKTTDQYIFVVATAIFLGYNKEEGDQPFKRGWVVNSVSLMSAALAILFGS